MNHPLDNPKVFNALAGIAFAGGLGLIAHQVYDLHEREKPAVAAPAPAPDLSLLVPCGLPGQVPSLCQVRLSPEQYAAFQRSPGGASAAPQESRTH